MAKEGSQANVSNPAQPPFGNGKGATQSGSSSSGGHNFLTEPSTKSTMSGGRDFTKESRPQSMAKQEVVPNPQEIPAGGVILKADPGPVSAKVAGTACSIGSCPNPFKLKG